MCGIVSLPNLDSSVHFRIGPANTESMNVWGGGMRKQTRSRLFWPWIVSLTQATLTCLIFHSWYAHGPHDRQSYTVRVWLALNAPVAFMRLEFPVYFFHSYRI